MTAVWDDPRVVTLLARERCADMHRGSRRSPWYPRATTPCESCVRWGRHMVGRIAALSVEVDS